MCVSCAEVVRCWRKQDEAEKSGGMEEETKTRFLLDKR